MNEYISKQTALADVLLLNLPQDIERDVMRMLADMPAADVREAENEPVNAEEVEHEAAERYGIRSQSIVAIEEMSELQKELTKLLRGECENRIDHVSEEMADVYIMLGQLEILLNNRAIIDEWKDKKLRRLRDKLRKDSEE